MQRSQIPSHRIHDGVTANIPLHLKDVLVSGINEEGKIMTRQYPHRHDYYEIMLLNESEGIHYIDFIAYPFKGPAVFILSPEQVHELARKSGSRGFSLKFNAPFFSSGNDPDNQLYAHFLFDNLQAYPVIELQPEEYARLQTLMTLALQEYNLGANGAADILYSYIRVILMEILRIRKQHLQETHLQQGIAQTQLLTFKKLLHQHFQEKHAVQDYAALLHITPQQLNAVVQKLTGKTAGTLIKERILLEAKRLLFMDTLSVKEIGYQLGFEDPAYFNRFFKKNTGLAPQQFREQAQQA
ncbi:MAG: helix-turn-helix domain-containing protein [Chitinophaga sp.]|uniref:helix-turn-helix domain-containing protein n=1 Tax=Chitinophaga sp. TaxID=1869181 RepID=UPI001B1F54EB|nr:helix-turn-helix domain-containing protein [Chitinophaga sp.]MBO9728922.1 helix-turn-helix domain-containing protein [Chitinophaga sp.]